MEVLLHPNTVLKARSEEVDPTADDELRELTRQMARIMYEAPGVGLAAPQVGVLKRVIVYDVDEGKRSAIALCNPRIVEASDACEVDDEGCLSLPGITVPILRPVRVTCEALSLNGKKVRIKASDFHARVLQHEIDHLDGMLIIDRATPEERKAALQRYRDALAHGAKPGQTHII
ncbi:MAG: peptide deformylase [Coriobacteriia bacterium]|nr:peptide deformylase [Coriobacteriia bacterium]